MSEYEVKILRLRHSPEEFLCRVFDDAPKGKVKFSFPFLFGMINQSTLGFQPWSPLCAEREFVLSDSDVLFINEPMAAVVKDYQERVSGLQLPATVSPIVHK